MASIAILVWLREPEPGESSFTLGESFSWLPRFLRPTCEYARDPPQRACAAGARIVGAATRPSVLKALDAHDIDFEGQGKVLVDAMNAMRTLPSQFKSFGHDYRADTANFVHVAYQLNSVTDSQQEAMLNSLRQLELGRGKRIKATKAKTTDRPTTTKRTKRRIGLCDRTPKDRAEPAIAASPE